MISGIIGLILSFLVVLNGFSALRRPLAALTQFDPIGKWLLKSYGDATTLRIYRIFGLVLVLVGMAGLYLAVTYLGEGE